MNQPAGGTGASRLMQRPARNTAAACDVLGCVAALLLSPWHAFKSLPSPSSRIVPCLSSALSDPTRPHGSMKATLVALAAYASLAQASPRPVSSQASRDGSSLHLPMIRRQTSLNPEQAAAYFDHVRAKYNYPTVASRRRRARATNSISILNEVRLLAACSLIIYRTLLYVGL
jgi:hypothetical protein